MLSSKGTDGRPKTSPPAVPDLEPTDPEELLQPVSMDGRGAGRCSAPVLLRAACRMLFTTPFCHVVAGLTGTANLLFKFRMTLREGKERGKA